ncbi:MAG: hydroxymethylglutaryl-CoA reductase [Candidatus Aenigmarchaeota archaeon]|nr:hydroxymethylglutaryl-CoA reductase [Candidatus Aenigmarchaeota archaeon]
MDKIKKDFFNKKIKFYELEKIIFEKNNNWPQACKIAADWRRERIENELNISLPLIKNCFFDTTTEKKTTGIEQKIGGAAVPLAISNPIKIKGEHAKGDFYIPLATNEAALVAGLNRGIKALNTSGVIVKVTDDKMCRAPVLEFNSINDAYYFTEFIEKNDKKLKQSIKSEFCSLVNIKCFQIGRYVWTRFCFTTGDAMGMNSVTKYSAKLIKEIKSMFDRPLKLVALSGNLCTDKKAAYIDTLLGRGKSVHAECVIKNDIIKKIWNTDAKTMKKICFVKNYLGSGLSGTSGGFNANAANTIAAIFIATGQDAAEIVESSSCFTRAEYKDDTLLFSVTLPSLEIATVGGGTNFGTAAECLKILGCHGGGSPPGSNAKKLAEIIASAVMAQELNLIGTLANEYELAESHITLARGGKK